MVEDIVSLPDGGFRVSGSASLDDLRQHIPIAEDFDSVTVTGWVLEVLGHVPQPGDTFDYNGFKVTVESAARRKVDQILIENERETV